MMSPSLEHTPPEVMIGLAIHDPAWRDLNIETDLGRKNTRNTLIGKKIRREMISSR